MDLDRTDGRLKEREVDLERLQEALRDVEKERAKLGESATTAKFSLQLEVDRLKRDLERAEDELSRLRTELASREAAYRDREAAMDKLHSEHRDLASELAAQTQARLNLSEKLDEAQKSLREKEGEVSSLRTRLNDVEGRLSKDSRALVQAEGMYRDQLTERNTLLLTIYQYLDKILGVEKTPVSPFTALSPRRC
jgi:chromosome segregation ATPase